MELNNNITDTTQNMLLLNAIGVVSGNMSSKLSKKKNIFYVIETKGQGKNQVSTVYVERYLVGRRGKSLTKSISPTLILTGTLAFTAYFFSRFTYPLIK